MTLTIAMDERVVLEVVRESDAKRGVFRLVPRGANDIMAATKVEGAMGEHNGRCFCGAVEISVTGEPVAMGFCHCASCREWSAGPINAFTLWKPEAVKITKGADQLGGFLKNPTSNRRWCKACGGHVLTEHPTWGVTDVYAATLREFAFRPGLHVNYGETVLRIKDGLPKQKDMPAEMGGSGTLLPE